MKVKEESEKTGLKCNVQKTKIMASSPITSSQIDGKTMETVRVFIFGGGGEEGSKVTSDSDCSHEIKRCLLLGRTIMTRVNSIFESRDITLPIKVHLVKSKFFPVVMCGCESRTIKKAECWIIGAFELFVGEDSCESLGRQGDPNSPFWRKSVLNIHWKDWCWSWTSNTLATWCVELTHLKRPWCWERLKARGEGE